VHGAPSRRRPTLFVANHTSYLDISIIGAVVEGSFVAKAEVARWPLFGWLAKLQRSVFVDRRVRSTHVQRDQLRERLDAGDSLILFPEGTSDDGMRVLPFKSALLSVADYRHDGVPLAVQPVTVAYLRLDGIPLGRFLRPFFAWYGDMELAPHLWSMLGLGVLSVSVQFHPVVTLAEFGSRKALAEHCHRVVSAGLSLALAGRLRPAADAPARVPAGEPAAAAADAAGTS
jgi:1-acyl-sn-glycerol-3-phosphate acyltransferase